MSGLRDGSIALVSLDQVIGDLVGNSRRIRALARQASRSGASLVVFPELALTGYPPEDLLELPGFVEEAAARLEELARSLGDIEALVGFPERHKGRHGKRLYNSAAFLAGGEVRAVYRKRLLPTYDVFDERRYFQPGTRPLVVRTSVGRVGVTICEDAWNDKAVWNRTPYKQEPMGETAAAGAELLINLSASPFSIGKRALRRRMLGRIAKRTARPLLFANLVGGNDDLLFDGSSCAFDGRGRCVSATSAFEDDILLVRQSDLTGDPALVEPAWPEGAEDELPVIWSALVRGTRDYARKCGFTTAVLGLSGGIDSALTATIAADALGPENVTGVLMPGPYSSAGSVTDARRLVSNLGLRAEEIPIGPALGALTGTLAPIFGDRPEDTTEENLQARVRGVLLMALSNKFGHLLLTTGNKSELAVGYATLYGDMCGGLAVISDVPKTLVWDLARFANHPGERIPPATIDKPPSAELRPNQTDQDSLPPYDRLDAILEAAIEQRLPAQTIAAELRIPIRNVRRILAMVDRAEYKRQQAAPGLRITSKAFGPGRKFPIAQGYRR